jgi:gluconate 5-dehydrogenase
MNSNQSTSADPRSVDALFDLTGRAALITGASGWLGRCLASALAEAGATVVAASRDAAVARRVAGELPRPRDQTHRFVAIDQLNETAIDEGFERAVESAGGIDILVNNGHAAAGGDWTNVDQSAFDRMLSNASGYFLLSRRLRDHLVQRGAVGSIVNLGSMYGQVASYPDAYQDICPASPVAYHALKGGIIQMTRHLAVYWAGDGVRVNCLSPGPFPSPDAPAGLAERLSSKSPMGRMGEPHELKGALLLLASDAGSYITGQNLTVDGGWTAW